MAAVNSVTPKGATKQDLNKPVVGFVEHLSQTKVEQQSVIKIISLIFLIWSHIKLKLNRSICSTNWPLRWICLTSKSDLNSKTKRD